MNSRRAPLGIFALLPTRKRNWGGGGSLEQGKEKNKADAQTLPKISRERDACGVSGGLAGVGVHEAILGPSFGEG